MSGDKVRMGGHRVNAIADDFLHINQEASNVLLAALIDQRVISFGAQSLPVHDLQPACFGKQFLPNRTCEYGETRPKMHVSRQADTLQKTAIAHESIHALIADSQAGITARNSIIYCGSPLHGKHVHRLHIVLHSFNLVSDVIHSHFVIVNHAVVYKCGKIPIVKDT